MKIGRRSALQWLAGGAALASLPRWARATEAAADDYFIFVHASGGWDVTLWSDPRNERTGLIEPASTDNTDPASLLHWKPTKLDGDTDTFEILAPSDSKLVFGPGIGALYDLRDRLTIINGLAMNTVSHPDGTAFASTGRHLAGGRAPASSVDVAVANELGTGQLIPDVAVQFPSSYVGERLDRRAIPLRVSSVATIAKSLARSPGFFTETDRADIAAAVIADAHELARRSTYPESYERIASQAQSMQNLLGSELEKAFTQKALADAYPQFDFKAKSIGQGALGAAFAVEAMKRDVVRCVGFSLGGLDTHNTNYKQHAQTLQEVFGTIATLLQVLDVTPHPHRSSAMLSHHTHIYVFSDFCRTPQINIAGGRDHYPNNSALIISPRFRGGRSFGATDREQLLPADAKTFSDGKRAVAPPDVLATFLHAFGIDHTKYLRDGEVIPELLV
jgi:Protein of unknown function (DUF1501)